MPPIKIAKPAALIFDMDGVLVDSEPLHKRAKELAFGELGIVLPESVYDSYKGRPDRTMMPEVLALHSPGTDAERVMQRKKDFYEQIEHQLRPVDGAAEFVHWAASRYRLALATSATPRNRAAALRMLGIENCFESIVDTDRFHRAKPDPEIFQVAMRDLKLPPDKCWVVEDSLAGVAAGKAAGSFTVAITTTFDRKTLADAGSDLIVESFVRLKAALESI
ncbi:MAG TPA: HAD family phosphatase [Candidatus Acidoferrales bacterium]|nr:HAD family phosphatase [Candidatus Acidoferrales bacterium]